MLEAANIVASVYGFGHSDKILLRDLQVITLHYGRMTTARRTHPVPQLNCVGGSAGCASFIPAVVQCYNRGTNGIDVQWECKSEMDNFHRFGEIEVLCEGYDYPNDPYVLIGSCGLEYHMEFTEAGRSRQQYPTGPPPKDGRRHPLHEPPNNFIHIVVILLILAGVFVIYKTCLAGAPSPPEQAFSQPPPAGFRSDYMPPPPPYESCSSSSANHDYNGARTRSASSTSTGPGGFWTGATLGGLAGYFLGNRGNSYTHLQQPHHRSPNGSWTDWMSGWGSNTTYRAPTFTSSPSTASTPRTASGFGGTKRR